MTWQSVTLTAVGLLFMTGIPVIYLSYLLYLDYRRND